MKPLLNHHESDDTVSLTPAGWDLANQVNDLYDAGYTEELAAGEVGLKLEYLQYVMTVYYITMKRMESASGAPGIDVSAC